MVPLLFPQAGDPQRISSPPGWLRPLTDASPGAPVSARHRHLLQGHRYGHAHVPWASAVCPMPPGGWGCPLGAETPRPWAVETAGTHGFLGGGDVQGPASSGGAAEVPGNGGLSGPQVSSRGRELGPHQRPVCADGPVRGRWGKLCCELTGVATTRGHTGSCLDEAMEVCFLPSLEAGI